MTATDPDCISRKYPNSLILNELTESARIGAGTAEMIFENENSTKKHK